LQDEIGTDVGHCISGELQQGGYTDCKTVHPMSLPRYSQGVPLFNPTVSANKKNQLIF
jgi:hypothetical protein|tara:strand:+ start:218 stop:391 length:174 start_codon:yes stop_codon:yes gene_type:complete